MKPATLIKPPAYWDLRDGAPRRVGLLPMPPLAKALMAVGAVVCVVFVGFVATLLGWV